MTAPTTGKPKVSIIIPAYQHAGEIGDCLESVFRQSFRDFEIIVVNDGSTDNTLDVLRSYADRIKIITQENRGGNAARNRGFDESRGDFLLFCDADIVMRPDMVEKMLQTLLDNPEASYAYSSFSFGWKRFRLWPFDPATLRRMNFIHTTSLIRREHFPRFDESIRRLQDWDLWLTMLERGHVGVWVPEYLFKAIPHRGCVGTWVPGSNWVPGIFYRLPWLHLQSVEKYRQAEKIVKAKHHLS